MNKYAARFLLLGGAKLLRIPIAIFTTALLSRTAGPEGVGQWSMVVATAVFFHALCLGWTQAQAVRVGRVEWLEFNRLSDTWAARAPLILAGLVLSVLILAFRPFSFFENLTQLPSSWWLLVMGYLIGTWCFSEAQLSQQATGRFGLYAVSPLILDTLIASFLFSRIQLGGDAVISMTIGGMVGLTVLFSALLMTREMFITHAVGGKSSTKAVLQVASFGGPFALAALMGFASDWGDHFLLQYFHGAEQVGLFQAGYQTMAAAMALAAPVAVVFLPKLVDQSRHDPLAEADYVQRVIPVVATFWLLAIIPCIAVLPSLFSVVFGHKFQPAQPVLLALCISVPGAIFSYLYTVLFNIQGRSLRPAMIVAAMAMMNFTISFALIPDMGGLGAAAGTAISYFLMQLLYMADQHRYLSVPAYQICRIFLIGATFGAAQCYIGEELTSRLLLAVMFMAALILQTRRSGIADRDVVANLLPRRAGLIARAVGWMLSGKRVD